MTTRSSSPAWQRDWVFVPWSQFFFYIAGPFFLGLSIGMMTRG